MKLANSANPTHSEATLVRSSAGLALAAMSTSGDRRPALDQHEDGKQDGRDGQQPDRPRRSPSPHGGLAQRQQQAEQGHGEQDRAGEVEPALPCAGPARRGTASCPAATRQPPATQDPEQQVVVGVLADQSGQRQAERPADAEHRADQRDAGQRAARGQRHGDQADAERNGGQRQPRHAAPDDQRNQAVAQGADERADGEEAGAHHEHQPLAVHVAQPPDDRDGHARGQQRRGQQPLGAGRRAAEVLGYLRQHRDQHRHGEGHHQAGRSDHRDARRPGWAASHPHPARRPGLPGCRPPASPQTFPRSWPPFGLAAARRTRLGAVRRDHMTRRAVMAYRAISDSPRARPNPGPAA